MKPKILVTRKITDEAENNLAENFDVTFNKNDEPIPYEIKLEVRKAFSKIKPENYKSYFLYSFQTCQIYLLCICFYLFLFFILLYFLYFLAICWLSSFGYL